MSLFENFFKVLSLYLEARIRIRNRIKVKGRIRIRIKVTSRIRIRIRIKGTSSIRIRICIKGKSRIRIKVMRIRNTGCRIGRIVCCSGLRLIFVIAESGRGRRPLRRDETPGGSDW